jgi:hypothetical protein
MRAILSACVSLGTVGLVHIGPGRRPGGTWPGLRAGRGWNTAVVCCVSHVCWAFKMNTVENL